MDPQDPIEARRATFHSGGERTGNIKATTTLYGVGMTAVASFE